MTDTYTDDMAAPSEVPDEAPIDPSAFVESVTSSNNFAEMLSEGEASEIAQQAIDDWRADKDSMSDWLDRMERGIKLATLSKEAKTYPFKDAANVKYPLVTTAALQFNARAYPAIVPSGDVVRIKTFGKDPTGQKAARADRVSAHMSYKLTGEGDEWEEDTDRMLVQLPIVGTMIRKIWWDGERARGRVIEPGKFVVNDNVSHIDDAPRATEELTLYPYEIGERWSDGRFVQFEYSEDEEATEGPQDFIEQHCRLDLDEDGYPEPYIVTVHVESETLVRIVADFDAEDVSFDMQTREVPSIQQQPSMDPMTGQPIMAQVEVMVQEQYAAGIKAIRRGSYFVPYHFIPAIDGRFWGTGLGILLGDISDAVNTSINMMLDAGHFQALGGGFIGSELRLKGGQQRMQPGEYRTVTAPGRDIRTAIVDKTFPGPSQTMFAMLGMLIDAGKDVASVKDIMTGDTGTKNMTATTTLALIEQGMMVFTASYKRIFRALKREFRLYAKIYGATTSPEEYAAFNDGQQQFDPRRDYDLRDMDISPVADPRSVTKMQDMAKAQLVMQLAETGLIDKKAAATRILEAADIPDIEELMPKEDPMKAQVMQMQMQSAQADLSQKMAEIQLTIAKVEEAKASAAKDTVGAQIDAREAQLNELQMMLRTQSNGLQRTLARGVGPMAGAPGNGMPSQPSGPPARPMGRPMQRSGMVGQPVARQPAPGAAPNGGMVRGLL